MYWKTAIACLAGLMRVVDADANGQSEIGSCPAGYSLTTYLTTYLVTVKENPTSEVNHWTAGLPTATSWPATFSSNGPSTLPSSTTSLEETKKGTNGSAPVTSLTLASTSTENYSRIMSTRASNVNVTPKLPVVEPSQISASSLQSSSTPLVGGVVRGQATSYDGGDVDGTCMFSTADYTLPAGIYGAALSVDNWNSAAWCGACLSVLGPSGNSIKIMVSGKYLCATDIHG